VKKKSRIVDNAGKIMYVSMSAWGLEAAKWGVPLPISNWYIKGIYYQCDSKTGSWDIKFLAIGETKIFSKNEIKVFIISIRYIYHFLLCININMFRTTAKTKFQMAIPKLVRSFLSRTNASK
jgi:hypothetical protein